MANPVIFVVGVGEGSMAVQFVQQHPAVL